MSLISNTFTVTTGTTAPAWFTALSNSTGTVIGSNTMASVAQSAVYGLTRTWIGGAADQLGKKFVIGSPGGHQDPGTNAVFEFRLADASPQWYRTRTGESDGAADQENGSGVTGSGQPTHTHSYHRQVCSPGRLWLPGLDSMSCNSGVWTTSTFSYGLSQTSAGVWNIHGRGRTSGSINKWLGGSAAYDSVNDRVFSGPQWGADGLGFYFTAASVVAAGNVSYPNAITGASTFSMPGALSNYNVMLAASDLRLLILIEGSSLWTLNLDNIGGGWTSRSLGAGNSYSDGDGYVYHPGTRKMYRYANAGTVRVIDIPTTLSNTWSGRNASLSGTTIPTASYGEGDKGKPYSRFNIVNDMGNGQACLLFYPTHTYTGMWVCKMPSGGL